MADTMATEEDWVAALNDPARDLAMLSGLIRLCIHLAVRYSLIETEHELRRALLGLDLEAPDTAANQVETSSTSS